MAEVVARAPGAAEHAVTVPRLRSTLGRFATGVTVVTSAVADSVRGLTLTAFTSVSLNPALVLVSVALRAATNDHIAASGRYGVSVLGEEQRPLAVHFSGGRQRPELVEFVWRNETPLVRGALVHLTCEVRATHAAGDHLLHVGEVTAVWSRDGEPLVCYASEIRPLSTPSPVGVDFSTQW